MRSKTPFSQVWFRGYCRIFSSEFRSVGFGGNGLGAGGSLSKGLVRCLEELIGLATTLTSCLTTLAGSVSVELTATAYLFTGCTLLIVGLCSIFRFSISLRKVESLGSSDMSVWERAVVNATASILCLSITFFSVGCYAYGQITCNFLY